MFVFLRAIAYAALFIGFFLVYIPRIISERAGDHRPADIEAQQIVGISIAAAGAVIAVWCVFTFALRGRGTPAPFDPPRRLVIGGPYRIVRNPMYVGAVLALVGAAIFYGSYAALCYAIFFFACVHLFVVLYEEPALRRAFGSDYDEYCRKVKRWLPSF
jgi:protein-S-isoprenylcysteine O-methyltransferase Ste14